MFIEGLILQLYSLANSIKHYVRRLICAEWIGLNMIFLEYMMSSWTQWTHTHHGLYEYTHIHCLYEYIHTYTVSMNTHTYTVLMNTHTLAISMNTHMLSLWLHILACCLYTHTHINMTIPRHLLNGTHHNVSLKHNFLSVLLLLSFVCV